MEEVSEQKQEFIALADFPAYLAKREKTKRKVALQTIYRWVASGLAGVRLDVVYKAGKPYVEVPGAIDRFDTEVTAAKSRMRALPLNKSTQKQATKAHAKATKRLQKQK